MPPVITKDSVAMSLSTLGVPHILTTAVIVPTKEAQALAAIRDKKLDDIFIDRQARLSAWKVKLAQEAEQKGSPTTQSAHGILEETDKKPTASPTPSATQSTGPQSPEPTNVATTNSNTPPVVKTTPAPHAGKFDPKAIARKAAAAAALAKSVLGGDVKVPQTLGKPTINNPTSARTQVDTSKTFSSATPTSKCGKFDAYVVLMLTPADLSAGKLLDASGRMKGFGLSNSGPAGGEKIAPSSAVNLEDEVSKKLKLEKLLPLSEDTANIDDTALANSAEDPGDDDGDLDMAEGGTEEENAAAARAAAEKREQRLQQESQAYQAAQTSGAAGTTAANSASKGDVEMVDAATETSDNVPAATEEEEMDPLDAFMNDLDSASRTKTKIRGTQNEPEALFSDDEELDAIKADTDDILAMVSKRKKKELPAVNHGKMTYEPFRKNFYTEPADLADMTEEDVLNLRAELDGIKVRGINVPKPILKWSQCGLGTQTLDVITRLGFEKPTSIQAQAVPAIMSGRDVIGVAKTGSGKTIAFLLPMFRHIKDQRPLENLDGPIGLIMAPTRELATQIHRECKPFLRALTLRAVCAYGGAPIKDQIAELKRGAEIVVCTPGRLIDLLTANGGRVINLRRVTYVVLDEADRMFDMGFEPQVLRILNNIRPQRQTVLFSATFPKSMEALARKSLIRPIEIIVGGRSVVAPEITQIVEVRSEESKFARLLGLFGEYLIADEDRALVFVDRQESAESLLRDVNRKGYPCNSIHGGRDQFDRDDAIADFKKGIFPVLIATSVAARGLDVKQLKLVVNYDCPNHLEDYVHRAGRTGRAGNTGTAVTFVKEDQERFAVDISKALKHSGQPVPEALQKLVDSFQDKVKSGLEKEYKTAGFSGKGLDKLDEHRDAERTRERKTFKAEEGDEDEDKVAGKDAEMDKIIAKAAGGGTKAAGAVSAFDDKPTYLDFVPRGIDLDGKVKVIKTEVPAPGGGPISKLDKVAQAAANINNRLGAKGALRTGPSIDNKGPDAGAYHATLEINDFPQKARWAVTNRTNVAKILEATGTSITTKGSFYDKGKEPGQGENPKLYILVEGDTEVVVTTAMQELMRLLKEGTIAAADVESRAPASGRYSVL
ncbi:pre-mRNA processing RNA-helicase [Elasticomyces elasticus]|nr:pre-mRNA processing RNA-helicase [Elasticomyces elasticus]